ncbi:hypothetical protein CEXT_482981 [Caerostris extrusa]|uniref:Uncharacterized protein n=1 Tax=Caerostris extrusa TaxID=172846 RepID=A0AAV4VAB0_CAEEX|nr:hypothetical protein CEXT_482981 [Caerostris extrusa]
MRMEIKETLNLPDKACSDFIYGHVNRDVSLSNRRQKTLKMKLFEFLHLSTIPSFQFTLTQLFNKFFFFYLR